MDLYVLERAIASAHAADAGPLFDGVIEEYRRSSRLWNPVLNKFAEGECVLLCVVMMLSAARRRVRTLAVQLW